MQAAGATKVAAKQQIDGVEVIPLSIIPDERGQVMHMIRSDAPHFDAFGEMYFSCIYPDVTKGWKLHATSGSKLAVPVGRVKFVLCDLREDSPTKGAFQDVYLGDNSYKLLIVPPGIAYAWKNLLQETAVVANCATEPHRPGEGKMIPLGDLSYAW